MKNKLKVSLAFLIVFVISTCSVTFADVGNINRYSGGSSSSSSSSSHSSSSSSHSNSSHSSRSHSTSSDSSSSSSVSRGSSSGSSITLKEFFKIMVIPFFRTLFPFFVILFLAKFLSKKLRKNVSNSNSQINEIRTDTKRIADKIRIVDPEFSEEKFLLWTKEMFIKLQEAWTARDWKMIRPFESNELFEQHSTQLQEYINNNRINVVEKININFCELMNYKVDGDKEILEVYLKATMRDYIIDATTKEVIEGNKDTDWNMKYKLIFERKNGVKTHIGTSNKSTTNCPNCGAPTEITSSGQCEYCGSIVTTGEYDWVLTGLEGLN